MIIFPVNESLCFKKFNRNNIIDMNTIFYECLSLKESEFSNFITNNVEDMNNMFNECLSLVK